VKVVVVTGHKEKDNEERNEGVLCWKYHFPVLPGWRAPFKTQNAWTLLTP
jgi:hypothetical protein